MSKHEIVHIEISANEPKSTGEFYKNLFGWGIVNSEAFDYVQFDIPENISGGFPKVGDNTKAGDVVIYVSTDDIEASLEKAASLGGKILMTKTEIPSTGWFGLFQDPTGNVIGVYTPLPK